MNKPRPHESARLHVTGLARYVSDIADPANALHGLVVYSGASHAEISKVDLDAARRLPGVAAILTAADIPGINQMGPVIKDEPCLVEKETQFIGQAVCLIAARNRETAHRAHALIQIKYKTLSPVLDINQAIKKKLTMGPTRKIERGHPAVELKKCPRQISGELRTGAQEHWYLEPQASLCLPGEGNEITVFSSTQHPSETQTVVAGVLGLPRNQVRVEVKRLGGGFGGKETQANHTAAWCALLCRATGKPVLLTLPRRYDQIMTGKRHPFLIRYRAGFDDRGLIRAAEIELNSDGGAATDLSFPIMERAMFHTDNAYFIPHIKITGTVWKTNHPPNTAFRGFGGPQGMAVMETIVDRIARVLHEDAAVIRHRNFYGTGDRNITPYGQKIERNKLTVLFNRLLPGSEYYKRREDVNVFNNRHRRRKRGLAITPVKFGISFTTSFLNQAGALVHFYTDGTVMIHHGGTEMGQGLHTKILDIACSELGLPPESIKMTATDTAKVPNTSATAASSGADLNGMAVKNAIDKLKRRITPVVVQIFGENHSSETNPDDLRYANGYIYDSLKPNRNIEFRKIVELCHQRQISLSATGFYATPGIRFDRDKGQGKPFHYFAFGMAVSEVEVDLLTGAHRLLRTDILHDVGKSINPGIDRGQIEGGFVQGVGWCTCESCNWDETGRLLNDSPSTYKIPTITDIPRDFRVQILDDSVNPNTISNSKAVGEPPFMLGLSVWLAIKDAVSAAGDHQAEPEFSLPATNETILKAVQSVRANPF